MAVFAIIGAWAICMTCFYVWDASRLWWRKRRRMRSLGKRKPVINVDPPGTMMVTTSPRPVVRVRREEEEIRQS